jgi:hypothetical protein
MAPTGAPKGSHDGVHGLSLQARIDLQALAVHYGYGESELLESLITRALLSSGLLGDPVSIGTREMEIDFDQLDRAEDADWMSPVADAPMPEITTPQDGISGATVARVERAFPQGGKPQ